MITLEMERIGELDELIECLKKEQMEEMEARRAAVKRAFEDQQQYMKGFDPWDEEPPDKIKDLIKKRGEEWQDSLKLLEKSYKEGLTLAQKQFLQERQTFQEWLLAQPADSGYKLLAHPYDYFQWTYKVPAKEVHNVANYTPLTWPALKDKDAHWVCDDFHVEVQTEVPWVWPKEWHTHSSFARIGGFFKIPGALITKAGMLSVAPVNRISGTVAAQAPANTSGRTVFTAEVTMTTSLWAVGQSYVKPGGGTLGTHHRQVLRKGGANAWFKDVVNDYTWPKLYDSAATFPVVPGVDIVVAAWNDFEASALGIPCAAYIDVKFESDGLLVKLP